MKNKFSFKRAIIISLLFLSYYVGDFYYKEYLAKKELSESLFYNVIKTYQPNEYEEVLKILSMVKRNETSLEYFKNHVELKINPILKESIKQFPNLANDELLYKYYGFMIKVTELTDSEICYNFLYTNDTNKSKFLDDDKKNEFIGILSEILKTYYTVEKKQNIIDKETFISSSKDYYLKIIKELNLDNNIFVKKQYSSDEKIKICKFSNRLYSELVNNKQSEILRYLLKYQ